MNLTRKHLIDEAVARMSLIGFNREIIEQFADRSHQTEFVPVL